MRATCRGAALLACAISLGCAPNEGLSSGSFAAGTGGAAGVGSVDGGAGGGSQEPPPPANGLWLMYGFEDPVSIDITLTPNRDAPGFSVSGTGCYAGPEALVGADPSARGCGPLAGQGVGSTMSFAIRFGPGFLSQNATYAAKVSISKDGTRLSGAFWSSGDTVPPMGIRTGLGWFRLEEIGVTGDTGVSMAKAVHAELGPMTWVNNRTSIFGFGGTGFVLRDAVALGGLVPGTTYVAKSDVGGTIDFITGDLGAFWNPDFHWDDATHTLTAGPVPETIPGLPVKLEIHVEDDLTVRDVVATIADGSTGTLLPVGP